MNHISTLIKQYRNKHDLTTGGFAKIAGISQASVSMIETGKRNPSTQVLKKISEVLEVSVQDILDSKPLIPIKSTVSFNLANCEVEITYNIKPISIIEHNHANLVINTIHNAIEDNKANVEQSARLELINQMKSLQESYATLITKMEKQEEVIK